MAATRKRKASDYNIGLKPLPVNEDTKFKLALILVAIILFLLVLSSIAEIFYKEPGDNVFNKSIIVLPPMITLIIGYYFSHRKP